MKGWLFVSFLLLGSLVAMTGLRQFFIEPLPTPGVNLVWFLMQLSPLLIPLPGLIRGTLRSTFTICITSLLYFIHGVLMAFDPNMMVFGGFEIAFSLGLCAVTALLVRNMREAEAAQPPQADNAT